MMEFELSKSGNYVQFMMESGRDLVMGSMKVEEAEEVINNVEVSKSEFTSFPIKAGVFCFKGKFKEEKKTAGKGNRK